MKTSGRPYLVVLHPHVEGLMPGVLDGLGPVPPPQGLRGKLARGHVGGASLLLRLRGKQNHALDYYYV